MDQLDGEPGLELGLVEAGERAPGIRRLELRRRVALLATERAIQAAEGIADPAFPGDPERVLAGRDLVGESERRGLRLAVERDTFQSRLIDRGALDLQIDCVKHDLAGRTRGAELDPFITGRGPGVEVEVEDQPVANWRDVLR